MVITRRAKLAFWALVLGMLLSVALGARGPEVQIGTPLKIVPAQAVQA